MWKARLHKHLILVKGKSRKRHSELPKLDMTSHLANSKCAPGLSSIATTWELYKFWILGLTSDPISQNLHQARSPSGLRTDIWEVFTWSVWLGWCLRQRRCVLWRNGGHGRAMNTEVRWERFSTLSGQGHLMLTGGQLTYTRSLGSPSRSFSTLFPV